MPRILWQNTHSTWLAAVVVVVVLALLWLGYRRSPLHGWRKLAAMMCKLAALALLALCLLDPLWTRQQPKKGENEVIVLVDTSPVPFVVRARSSSCMITGTLSAVHRTSVSRIFTPRSRDLSKAFHEFS